MSVPNHMDLFIKFDPPLDEKGGYKPFNFRIPNTSFTKRIDPNNSYWAEEDAALKFCEEQIFTKTWFLSTRNLIGKKYPWDCYFKGPFSAFDFYLPQYPAGEGMSGAVGEIKYTSSSKRDYWGYDLNERAIENAWKTVNFLDPYGQNKPRMKFFYVIMFDDYRGDFSLSVIDMYDKFKFVDDKKPLKEGQRWFARHGAQSFTIPVSKDHCFFRKDNPYYKDLYAKHGPCNEVE